MESKEFEISEDLLYTLESISFYGERSYVVKLVRHGECIETICEVRKIEVEGRPPLDLIRFNSVEFNRLCAQGYIYSKPLGKAIFAFHECIYPLCEE